MTARGGIDKGLETGATISASTIRIHTLDAVSFISVRRARKRLDRASWLVSCRLASSRSLPSGFGEIAQTGPGRSRE